MATAVSIKTSEFPNEVGPHTPNLQLRYVQNPVTNWIGRMIGSHRRHPTPEFHLDIYDEYAYGIDDIVFVAPRSMAKSTTTENFICFLACEYPRLAKMPNPPVFPFQKVMLASCTGPKAEEIMEHVRLQLETNENILAEYGDLRGRKWGTRRIITRDGFEFRVGGRGCQVRGFRPQLFIGDDLEDDEEVDSDEQREKTRRWLDNAVINTLDETECRGFFIGTDLHPESALNYLGSKPGIRMVRYQAYIGDVWEAGHELWPSKWPHHRLQRRRAKIGTRAFKQEFQNEPMITENPIFMKNWFRPYDPNSATFQKLLKGGLYTVLTCDPAISRSDSADYTALVTVSATTEKDPTIFIRTGGVKRGHWPLARTVVEAFNLYDRFRAHEVGVEKVAYQEALCDEINEYLEANRRSMRVTELEPVKDKERRAVAESPTVERGRVFFDPNDELHLRLIHECVNFQPGKKNLKVDVMDAFIYALHMVRMWAARPHGSSVKVQVEYEEGTGMPIYRDYGYDGPTELVNQIMDDYL